MSDSPLQRLSFEWPVGIWMSRKDRLVLWVQVRETGDFGYLQPDALAKFVENNLHHERYLNPKDVKLVLTHPSFRKFWTERGTAEYIGSHQVEYLSKRKKTHIVCRRHHVLTIAEELPEVKGVPFIQPVCSDGSFAVPFTRAHSAMHYVANMLNEKRLSLRSAA